MSESSYLPDNLLSDVLAEDDRDRIMTILQRDYLNNELTEEQSKCLEAYLKVKMGLDLSTEDEQTLRDIGSRLIWHKHAKDYTERELLVSFLNLYFDWETVDLDYSEVNDIKYQELWQRYREFVKKHRGEKYLKHYAISPYFKEYLSHYGQIARLVSKDGTRLFYIRNMPHLLNPKKDNVLVYY